MLCAVIIGPSFEDAARQIKQVLSHVDLIELRLDLFNDLNLHKVQKLRLEFSVPMIFTLRSFQEGGGYKKTEAERIIEVKKLLLLHPEYFDIESHVPKEILEELIFMHPYVKWILSYHNFLEIPFNVEAIFEEMQRIPAYFYKIAVQPKSSLETLKFLNWGKKKDKLIPIGLGILGQITRIIPPLFGLPMTYVGVDASMAPGQLTITEIIERYRYPTLNTLTDLYGLIGTPVEQSISDMTHNEFFGKKRWNALYLKMNVKEEELGEFLKWAKECGFKGLSVTMPLKEVIMPHLEEISSYAEAVGAVNTLICEKGHWKGGNTDGIGALNAIETHCEVSGKTIVILGAGGSAKAIAYEAVRRGAIVKIANRTFSKANALAQRLGIKAVELHNLGDYDILVNCTPSLEPIEDSQVIAGSFLMDIKTRPKETPFLKQAQSKGCSIIYGEEMFFEQARGQFHLWFSNSF